MQQELHTLAPEPRKGMPDSTLTETEFKTRFLSQFIDPNFDEFGTEPGAAR